MNAYKSIMYQYARLKKKKKKKKKMIGTLQNFILFGGSMFEYAKMCKCKPIIIYCENSSKISLHGTH